MLTTTEAAALGPTTLACLQALADQQDSLWDVPLRSDDPGFHARDDERQAAEVDLITLAMLAWAEATGRCADHFTIGITYALTESTHRCRNRAKDGPLCGTHAPGWEHRRQRAHARVESNRLIAETQTVADQLRAHGIEVTGVGATHLSIPVDTARDLIAHLVRVGGLA